MSYLDNALERSEELMRSFLSWLAKVLGRAVPSHFPFGFCSHCAQQREIHDDQPQNVGQKTMGNERKYQNFLPTLPNRLCHSFQVKDETIQ
jgi:hypothetical protein